MWKAAVMIALAAAGFTYGSEPGFIAVVFLAMMYLGASEETQ